MSNYLANLAARSVQKEPRLQPRPLSLFEPWPGLWMGALPTPTLTVVADEGEAWATAVSAPPPTPSLAPPTVTVVAGRHEHGGLIPPPTPSLAPPTVTTPQMAWKTAVQPNHAPPELPPPAQHSELPPASITIMREIARPGPPPPVQPAPAHITTTIHAAQQQPIQPAALPPAAPLLPAAVHPPVATDDGRFPTPSPPSPITLIRTQTTPPTLPAPATHPSIHHSPFTIHDSQFLPHPPEPAPIIQVTIGRIEVRATPPPPAREKRQSPSPAMSLDDYLRQRNGDQR
jgi:hypothetical protein